MGIICLGMPAEVLEVDKDENKALVSVLGLKSLAGLSLVGGAEPGEWVVIHAGQAIAKLDLEEAAEQVELWKEMLRRGSA